MKRETVYDRFKRMTKEEHRELNQRMLKVESHGDIYRILGFELIGYWTKTKDEPQTEEFKWPGDFVDESWDPAERALVLQYVKRPSDQAYTVSGGHSSCRLCAECTIGCCEFTDGVYVWPEGFGHYIEHHRLRPSQAFIDNVIANDGVCLPLPDRKSA